MSPEPADGTPSDTVSPTEIAYDCAAGTANAVKAYTPVVTADTFKV